MARTRTRSRTRSSKKKGGGFQYRKSDPDVVQRRAETKGDYDRPIDAKHRMFTPAEGKNRVRILPRTWDESEGPAHWGLPVFLHYSIGPDNGTYPCPSKMGWGKCPMCEERNRLDAEGDKEGAKELRPSESTMVWVIDRNKEEEGPKIWRMPSSKIERVICDLSRDDETKALIDVDHPDKGRDVSFTRRGTGQTTEYSAVAIPTQGVVSVPERG